MFDAEQYRSKEELAEWRKRDPLLLLTQTLKDGALIADADLETLERQVRAEVAEAVAFAEASPWESVEELTRFVYSDNSSVWKGGRNGR